MLKTMPAEFLIGLVISCLLAGGPALADERFVIKPPLQRQLESLVLPEVRLGDTDLMDALLYFQKKAQASSQGAVQVPFVVKLPTEFKPRNELSLDLKAIPFWEALRHLCGQAGVEFSVQRNTVTIRPAGLASARKPTVRVEMPAPAGPAAEWGLSGQLGKPAERLETGNVHRAMNGEIQREKSGSVGHRNLNGWPIAKDPDNKKSMNCVHIEKCKGQCEDGVCGCRLCSCK